MSKHKNITEPDVRGFQVRLVRNRKEYSRYFSHKSWGSKNKSLKAAINWRDQMLVIIGDNKATPIGQKSTGIVGVSRTIHNDKRWGSQALVYCCHWRKNDKVYNKSFQVGLLDKITADDEFHAFRTAVQFRKEYEFYKEVGREDGFDPEKYRGWKTEKLYGQRSASTENI
ncbi:MAG: hypothetical protein KAG19_05835 [Methylococcales bacterium]|nr:hypothetical protein [Methylococcales bacterium]